MWPEPARASRRPAPSLPVFGTESPPVATITASASSGGASRRAPRASRRRCGATPVTTRARRAAARRAARRARAARRGRRAPGATPGRASPTPSPRRAGCRASRSKKATCSASGQRAHDLAQRVRRRVGDEARLVQPRGEHVAAPAAADEDLAPAVARALQRARVSAPALGGEDRRHRARRARADHRDAVCHRSGVQETRAAALGARGARRTSCGMADRTRRDGRAPREARFAPCRASS